MGVFLVPCVGVLYLAEVWLLPLFAFVQVLRRSCLTNEARQGKGRQGKAPNQIERNTTQYNDEVVGSV